MFRGFYTIWVLLTAFAPVFGFATNSPRLDEPSYLHYIQNKGQWNENVLYRSDFRGGNLFVEHSAFTFVFYPKDGLNLHDFQHKEKKHPDALNFHAVRMEFEGATEGHTAAGEGEREFYHNYFIGNDPKKWASKVPIYGAVMQRSMYSGIDVKVFGSGNDVRYDFIVSPGANPDNIILKFTGQDRLSLRGNNLIIHTSVGEIVQQKPYAWQLKNGRKTEVACGYSLSGNRVRIVITGTYNKNLPLIIDPTVAFSTYTGSTADNWGMSASYDQYGNGYTAGIAFATGYPTTVGAFQTSFMGPGMYPGGDITLSKFNSTGSSLLFSTYLGGTATDCPQSITVDNNNCLIVLGRTYSTNFPVIAGCYDVLHSGMTDIIVTKFNAAGTALLGSTFIGGTQMDGVNYTDDESILGSLKRNYADDARGAVHVDELNNIYVASTTSSTDFPVTPGCFQPIIGGLQDGCVFKMNASLTTLLFSSFLGGNQNDAAYNLAIDWQDRLYVTGGTESTNFPTTPGVLNPSYSGGIDGFITHLSFSGNAITESSFIGTTLYDQSYFVQIDDDNNIYLYGQCSGNYPITAGVYSNANSGQFIHKMDPTLSTTIFSTEFGSGRGTPDIVPSAFLVDNCQNIYVSGWGGTLSGYNVLTSSTIGMPVTPPSAGNWIQTTTDGSDFYFGALSRDAINLLYATFFGGGSTNEHVDGGTSCFDKSGVIYQAICAACAMSSGMYTTPTAWSTTNNSNNCNNALVKFQMDLFNTVALANLDLFVKSGCAPFIANFQNFSANAVSYEWFFGDGNTSVATAPSYTYNVPGTYTVMLVATDLTTCNQRDTFRLVLDVLPPAALVPQLVPMNVCKGDTITLSINFPPANSYSWQPSSSLTNPNSSSPLAWPSVSTIYTLSLNDSVCTTISSRTVQVTVLQNNTNILASDSSGCTNNTLSLYTSTAYNSYSWSPGQTTSTITGFLSGLYTLSTIDANGCKGFDSIRIYTPVLLSSSYVRICEGLSTQLSSVSGSYQYKWEPPDYLNNPSIFNPVAGPPTTTIYTLTLINGSCTSIATHSVYIKPKPVVKITASRVDFCTTDTIQLRVNSSYSNYLWNTGDTDFSIGVLSSGLYSVVVSDTNGCSASDSLRVKIYPPLIVPSSKTTLCRGQNIQIFAPIGASFTYKWHPATYLSGTTIYNPVANPPFSMIYTLVISNGTCITAANYSIIVNPQPTLEMNLSSVTILPGESVQLVAKADTACTWYPPYKLSCTECYAPIASPEEQSVYYCYVVNKFGCSSTASITVDVVPTFYIPNTFTPNGDGLNEIFRPAFSGFIELNMMIFTRWGELIYSTNALDGGWDGTFKGKPAELGSYVYKINAMDYKHHKLEKTGPVILLR